MHKVAWTDTNLLFVGGYNNILRFKVQRKKKGHCIRLLHKFMTVTAQGKQERQNCPKFASSLIFVNSLKLSKKTSGHKLKQELVSQLLSCNVG